MSSDDERQVVVFDLAGEWYGVAIHSVREIIRMQAITFVPSAPEYVEGVINLRGRVIPVVDLRRRFQFASVERTSETRILVVDIRGEDIGVIVDGVREVQRIPVDAVEPAAVVATTEASRYIEGIAKAGERLLVLLDLERALGSDRSEAAAA